MNIIRSIAIALCLSIGLIGCATKNDKDMYLGYTKAVSNVVEKEIESMRMILTTLAESIPLATTPLERHLIREAIVKLQIKAQNVALATNGNDVAISFIGELNNVAKTAGLSIVGYKGMEVLKGITETPGSVTASDNAVVTVENHENHATAIGEESNSANTPNDSSSSDTYEEPELEE